MPNTPLIDAIGVSAAILTTLCWLPQALKVFRDKETRAISLPATLTLNTGILLWLIYGIGIGDWPVIGANAVSFVLMTAIIAMKLRYG
jgi:MtN3 and saliva related transmembrane protein